MAAHGLTEEMIRGQGGGRKALPFILAAIANVLISIGLAGIVGHLGPGQATVRHAIIAGVALWFAFMLTTMVVNYTFSQRKPVLIAIDGGHWLAVMVVMGAIIGAMGVH